MRTRSNRSRQIAAAVTAASFALGTLTVHPTLASATETQVSPDGKGIVGGALLGAEVVTITESIAHVHSGWAYGIGAILGAGAGGVAGHFVENGSSDGRAPVYMLAVGVGLVIPALVLSLNQLRYRPSDTTSEDHAPTNAPPANPGSPNSSSVTLPPTAPSGPPPGTVTSPAAAPASPSAPAGQGIPAPAPPGGGTAPPLSLFDMSGGSLRLGLPVPEVRQSYSMAELRQYGMQQQTEVRMPLMKVTF